MSGVGAQPTSFGSAACVVDNGAPERRRGGVAQEFARGWPLLLGSLIGIGVGVSALPAPAISVLMRPLQAQFGWTRAQISLGPTILVLVIAAVSPVLGWVADRIHVAWLCVVGLCGLCVSFLLFSRLGGDLRAYYFGFAALALAGSGCCTIPYARALSSSFVEGRGLALGAAMAGTGLTAMLLPTLLAPFAARAGWRAAYLVLALVVGTATPAVGVLMSRTPSSRTVGRLKGSDVAGVPFDRVLHDPKFWMLGAGFTLVPLATGGLLLHLLSFLRDAGLSAGRAGATAGLGGAFMILGRLGTGWLVDRLPSSRVAAAVMALGGLSVLGLTVFGASAALLGALAVGLTFGAEFDLIGYMTAQYFGMRAYGRIYGVFYTASLVGSSLSALFYGAVFDAQKNYLAALYAAVALLLGAAALFFALRPRAPRQRSS